ncbi:caspase family protein [Thermodesulfobacteriota bacterium]
MTAKSRKFLQVFCICINIVFFFLLQSVTGAMQWPKTAKPAKDVSNREIPAEPCYAPLPGSIISIAELPGSEEGEKNEIYPQLGHIVTAMAVSPDGRYVVSGGRGGDLKLWEVDSGREVWTIQAHQDKYSRGIMDVTFSPDGGKIYSYAQDTKGIVIWNPRTGQESGRISLPMVTDGHDTPGASFFTDPGTHVILSQVKTNWKCALFELPSGRMVQEFKGLAVNISPNGRYVITREQKGKELYWYLWDACKGSLIKSYSHESGFPRPTAFSPDGRYLTAFFSELGSNGKLQGGLVMYAAASGKEIRRSPVMENALCSGLTFSGDSQNLFYYGVYPPVSKGPFDFSMYVFNSRDGQVVRNYGKVNPVVGGIFARTPDGPYTLTQLCFQKEDKNLIRFIDNNTLEIKKSLGGHRAGFPVAMMPDGNLISYSYIWNPKTGLPSRKTGLPHDRQPGWMAVSSDGTELIGLEFIEKSATLSHQVTHWNIKTGKELKALEIPYNPEDFSGMPVLSPDGHFLLIKQGLEAARVVDLMSSETILTIQPPPAEHRKIWRLDFSLDGKSLAGNLEYGSFGKKMINTLVIWDLPSGRKRLEKDLFEIGKISRPKFAFSPDGKSVLISCMRFDPEKTAHFTTLLLMDAQNGGVIWLQEKPYMNLYQNLLVGPDGKLGIVQSESGEISLLNMASGRVIRKMSPGPTESIGNFFRFSPDMTRVYAGDPLQGIWIWDTATGRELARIMEFDKGQEWLSMTPEGYYASSDKGDQFLNVRAGITVQGIGQYYNVFYRPDLVSAKLQGDPQGEHQQAAEKKRITDVAASSTPPRVSVVSPKEKATLTTRDIEVIIDLFDTGGGIGTIEWKINGVTVGVLNEKDRGIAVVPKSSSAESQGIRLKQLLTLSPGENLIQVTANERTNEVTSMPVQLILNCGDEISKNPSLYLVTIGINKYRDGSLRLNYSVPDAKSIGAAFGQHSRSIFEKIVIEQVFDENATLKGIEAAFNKVRPQVQTQDVFVFYMAGHGVTQNGRYHFLPHDFRYRNEESIAKSGITQDHLQKWLATIKARKSLVLMDTCNSGAFTKAQALQRGIAEKTAVNRLTRATGRAIIVAAKDGQPALEGYQGHGVFTYVLLNAFKEADNSFGNRDQQTSIFEIAAYIDENVPEITYKQFGYEQIPQVNMQGRDFPIGVVK